jgi:hypothetical protein
LTQRLIFRDKRGKTQATIIAEAEEAARLEEELQAQRKADSKELAGETIRRELAESKRISPTLLCVRWHVANDQRKLDRNYNLM